MRDSKNVGREDVTLQKFRSPTTAFANHFAGDSLDSDRNRVLRTLAQATIQKKFSHGESARSTSVAASSARAIGLQMSCDDDAVRRNGRRTNPYNIGTSRRLAKIARVVSCKRAFNSRRASIVLARALALVGDERNTRFIKRQS
jgi:hypothetical protein